MALNIRDRATTKIEYFLGSWGMDYFGEILDEITEVYEDILRSPDAREAAPVLKALMRAMEAASKLEIARTRPAAEPVRRRAA